jgi:nucleotide-binding universal stress UspA family protein
MGFTVVTRRRLDRHSMRSNSTMSAFEKILVAADFSEGSRESFRVACALAREGKTQVAVLYVAEPMYAAAEPVYFGRQTVQFSIIERDPAYYEALKERLCEVYAPDHPLAVDYVTRVGAAADEILRAAEELGADLIVMGTHGRTGLRRLLAGSVAEAVLRRAPCPVLALRSPDRAREAEGIRVILHPTDFSDRSADALRVARTLARDHGARLVLLHVASNEITAEGMVIIPTDPAVYREALDEMRGRLGGPDLKFPVESAVREGDAAAEILRAAGEIPCDLIVMGTHGRRGLGRLLMGSVAEAVLRRALCPVLTIRAALPGRLPSSEVQVEETVGP